MSEVADSGFSHSPLDSVSLIIQWNLPTLNTCETRNIYSALYIQFRDNHQRLPFFEVHLQKIRLSK